MKLANLLCLEKDRVISIVGAGGKTTLMYTLAEELKNSSKVLVTTTTRIYAPRKEQYEYMALGYKNLCGLRCSGNKGIYVYGSLIDEENKLIAPVPKTLDEQALYFDYILIEADGSKRKPIKGWKDSEPVICSSTQKTIGVISIEVIGQLISEYNVHRIEEFVDIVNSKRDEVITIENVSSLIFHQRGLFKDAKGEKVLFINKVEERREKILAKRLLKNIAKKNNNYIDKIIFGSLRNKNYKIYHAGG